MMSPKWESKVPVPVHYLTGSGGPLNIKTFVGQDMASFFSGRLLAWTKNSKLRVDGSVMVDNDVSARFWFTMGFIMAKISKKPKIFIFGTKTHLYELICHPNIEEDQTKPVVYEKKSV